MPATAGIGLRAQHHIDVLETLPEVGWLEVHSENYFADGGPQREWLEQVRAHYPLSLHGVGLSLGSTDPLSMTHLRQLRRAIDRFAPALVSEHLAWSSVGDRFANDLLPMPYTDEALRHVAARVAETQDALGRQILIENVSSYVSFRCSELTEWEFLAALAFESSCGILLDINNVYVSSQNHGFDPLDYLAGIPPQCVGELHLAGHSVRMHGDRRILVDTHSASVCADVWDLYAHAIARLGPKPTLIEWDLDLPPLATLVAEAHTADHFLETPDAIAA
jgi:uncharacterized protein (UPF0276 family)